MKVKDLDIFKSNATGAIIISIIIDNQLIKKTYFGYSKKQAIKNFIKINK